MRSLPLFWKRQEQMWFALVWADGEVDRPNEDYGPDWYTVSESVTMARRARSRRTFSDSGPRPASSTTALMPTSVSPHTALAMCARRRALSFFL